MRIQTRLRQLEGYNPAENAAGFFRIKMDGAGTHPCGSHRFAVLRVGMDFRLKCEGCGHEMLVPRLKIERHIRRIDRPEPSAEG